MEMQTPRREFIRIAAGAAGAAMLAGDARAVPPPDARRTRSYNENMEYLSLIHI